MWSRTRAMTVSASSPMRSLNHLFFFSETLLRANRGCQ